MRVLVLAAAAMLALAACHPGGAYEGSAMLADVDRGHTNGRMFDFVSNRADGDDWNIRIRGASMYVSYGDNDEVKDLGSQKLTDKEMHQIWDLIDKVDIPDRKKGVKDEDLGYVELRLRVPGDDEEAIDQYEVFTTYVPRDNDTIDDDVLDLLNYLQKLTRRHFKTEPNF